MENQKVAEVEKNIVVFNFHFDGGHGWLEVPREEIEKRGLMDKISAYSYQRGSMAYLEEDCDASIFANALKAEGKTLKLKEINDGDMSPIKKYAHFGVDMNKTTGIKEDAMDIGQRIVHDFAGLKVCVEIVNVKYAYGNKRWLVRVAGQDTSNEIWINATK